MPKLLDAPAGMWPLLKRSLRIYRLTLTQVALFSFLLTCSAFLPRLMEVFLGDDVLLVNVLSLKALYLLCVDLFYFLLFAAMLERINQIVLGKPGSALSAAKDVCLKMHLLIGAFVLVGIILVICNVPGVIFNYYFALKSLSMWGVLLTTLGILLQWVPVVFVLVSLTFYLPLMVNEHDSVIGALRHSARLVWRHWWPTFWVLLIPWCVYLSVMMAVEGTFSIKMDFFYIEPQAEANWWGIGIHAAILAAFLPWFASVLLVKLRDLEYRYELGLDD